jgi:hypothetical protein
MSSEGPVSRQRHLRPHENVNKYCKYDKLKTQYRIVGMEGWFPYQSQCHVVLMAFSC